MSRLTKLAVVVVLVGVILFFIRVRIKGKLCESTARIDDKVVIVTGANTGIGKETARELINRGGRVYLACRSLEKAQQAADDIKNTTGASEARVIVLKLDLASFKSVKEFVEEFKRREKRLDILINNAAVAFAPYTITEDGYELTFQTNHLSHFLLTNLLLDALKAAAPSRIINVSSGIQRYTSINFDDLMMERDYGGFAAYSQSKLANVLFTRELAHRLQGTKVQSYSVNPGAVLTDILRNVEFVQTPFVQAVITTIMKPFLRNPWEGSQTSLCCALAEDLAHHSGKYYRNCEETDPGPQGTDDVAAKKLWDVSAELTGLSKTI